MTQCKATLDTKQWSTWILTGWYVHQSDKPLYSSNLCPVPGTSTTTACHMTQWTSRKYSRTQAWTQFSFHYFFHYLASPQDLWEKFWKVLVNCFEKWVLNITYKIMCTPSTKCTKIYTLPNGQLKISKSFSIKGTERLNFQILCKKTFQDWEVLMTVNQSHAIMVSTFLFKLYDFDSTGMRAINAIIQ